MPTVAERDLHQGMLIRLISRMSQWASEGELRATPTVLYLDQETKTKPDLFWVNWKNDQCKVDEEGYWHGTPDLIVEILSPATEIRDRGEKFALYEKHALREYWLINPALEFVEVFVLVSKRLARHGLYLPDQQFNSGALAGRTIHVNALFDRPDRPSFVPSSAGDDDTLTF
ncbi:MAG: Uma2 family endonuclease [Anaerolineae bacterium]|nr:Uma2 family endonuclease [Anaerolineae bacterium]